MDYRPNQSGLDKVFAVLGARAEAIDADLRERFAGRPIHEIVGPAGKAWESLGVQAPSPEWVEEYAAAVSTGEPFSLEAAED